MHVEPLLAVVLLAPLGSCGYDQDKERLENTSLLHGAIIRHEPQRDLRTEPFDFIQRTCALYVAVRAGALESPAAFGRDIDGTMVRWNLCPGGTMVACATVPIAHGDSARVGIPWPYHVGPRL